MEYLLLAVVFMGAGIAVVVVRNRRPTGTDASISEFEEHLDAITPPAGAVAPETDGVTTPGDESRGCRSG